MTRNASDDFLLQQSWYWKNHDTRFCRLCRQIPCSTVEVSSYGPLLLDHVATCISPVYVLLWIDAWLPRYAYTLIQLHAGSFSCCVWIDGLCFNMCPGWDEVIATDQDRRFGSRSWSELNYCNICGPGRQYTWTGNSGMVQWTSPPQSDLGGYSLGCPAGPSVDLYNAIAFADW